MQQTLQLLSDVPLSLQHGILRVNGCQIRCSHDSTAALHLRGSSFCPVDLLPSGTSCARTLSMPGSMRPGGCHGGCSGGPDFGCF